jgi:hypothetical protein
MIDSKQDDQATDALIVSLDWHGPVSLREPALFDPPMESGIYLWALPESGRWVVTYVGVASDLKDRMRNHCLSMLVYCGRSPFANPRRRALPQGASRPGGHGAEAVLGARLSAGGGRRVRRDSSARRDCSALRDRQATCETPH